MSNLQQLLEPFEVDDEVEVDEFQGIEEVDEIEDFDIDY